MNTLKLLAWLLTASVLFGAATAYAASPSELQIRADGTLYAKNIVVAQKAGAGNFFCRATWGDAFVRLVVLAHDTTIITKEHGEKATSDDIQVGDTLDVVGTLAGGDGALTFDAKTIRDHALQVERKTLSGTVKNIDTSSNSFALPHKTLGTVVVSVGANTTIQKGVRTIALQDMAAGDKVLSAIGLYNYTTNTFAASEIKVYQNPAVFTPRVFKGTLVSLSATVLPTTLTLSTEGRTYTAYLSATASVLSSSRAPASLSRFVVGDIVNLYGSIRQTNLNEIDASVVRDLKF